MARRPATAAAPPFEVTDQTFGQHVVGLSYNPSGDPDVYKLKLLYAEIIDRLDGLTRDGAWRHREVSWHRADAITRAQSAMFVAVEAVIITKARD
jgi:hypothetical protein